MDVRVRGLRDASGKLVSAPVRAVRAGMEGATASAGARLESEVERATDLVLAGSFPEAFVKTLVERRVLERVVSEMAASGELDRLITSAVADERTEQLVRHVAAAPLVQEMLIDAVQSPLAAELTGRLAERPDIQQAIQQAVQDALARNTATLIDRVAAGARRIDLRLDFRARRHVRGQESRVPNVGAGYAGLGSRITALLADLVAVHLVYLVGVGMAALILRLVNWSPSHAIADGLAAVGWLFVVVLYFCGFWTTAGQTPGMALLRLRLAVPAGDAPGWGRSFVRLLAGLVAVTFIFIGFLPVLYDVRRRALQDYVARTQVVYEPILLLPSPAGDLRTP